MWGIVRFSDASGAECGAPFVRDPRHDAAWALRRLYYAERDWFLAHESYTDDLEALGFGREAADGRLGLSAGADWFVATLALPDGGVLHIREDGRVW
jgi:hypothetical protein